jgi:hypothetical protein
MPPPGAAAGVVGRPCAAASQQHLVQLGQPGAAEFFAQEVPDDVVHGDGSVVVARH